MKSLKRTSHLGVQLFVCSVMLAGCVSPNLTRRYDAFSFNPSEPDGRSGAAITMFVMPVKKETNRTTLLNLSDRGQAALIKALDANADGDQLLEVLGRPIESKPSPEGTIQAHRLDRRFVFSIEKKSLQPADRISWARVQVDLPSVASNPKFTSWDKFSTQYAEVDLGKMTMNQSSTFNASVDLLPPQIREITGATIGGSRTTSLQEEVALKQRYVTLTGALQPQQAVLLQEGVVGIDLTGNSMLDVSIELEPSSIEPTVFRFAKLFDKAGAASPADAVEISTRVARFPKSKTPIQAKVTFEYIVRSVSRATSRTIMEGDDSVTYKHKSIELPPQTILTTDDLAFSVFELNWNDPSSASTDTIQIDGDAGSAGDIYFAAYDDAVQFLRWLRTSAVHGANPVQVRGLNLYRGGNLLTWADVGAITVKRKPMPQ